MPNVMPSPSAVHITLVYLGNKVLRDTTVSKKGPPQNSIYARNASIFCTQPVPTPRRNGRENRMRGK